MGVGMHIVNVLVPLQEAILTGENPRPTGRRLPWTMTRAPQLRAAPL
jgi:hypothetical protein